jgi:hypothetical protein
MVAGADKPLSFSPDDLADEYRPEEGKRESPANGGGENKEKPQEEPRRRRRNTQSGSQLDLQHGVRTMKVYPVTESDMLSLKLTTGLSSLLLSIGMALIGYSVEIFTDSSFAGTKAVENNPMTNYVAPICLACGGLLLLTGAAAAIGYWLTWGRVKKNTQTLNIVAKPSSAV